MDLPPTSPDHHKAEPLNLDLPPSKTLPLHKERKILAIALVVSVVLLLVAVGVAAWLFMQKNVPAEVITKVDPNSTNNVTSVSWVEPAIPNGYTKYNQSTNDAQVFQYISETVGCSLTTRAQALPDTDDLEASAVKLNDSPGIVTKTIAGSTSLTVKDTDSGQEYDFKGHEFDQDVNVPTLDYKVKTGVAYYREFGNGLATLSFSCKLASLESNAKDLNAFAKQFTIKTER